MNSNSKLKIVWMFAIKQTVEEANEQILVHCCSENSLETEVGQQADVSFFYLFHTLYVFALKIIQYYMRTVGFKEKITNIC